MPWHCPPLKLAGHAYQAPQEWLYDARSAFAALVRIGDAETGELFMASVRSQVEGLKGHPNAGIAAAAADLEAYMLAELDLIAPLSRPGAAQEPGEPPPEPEPPPPAAARPGPPQEPDEAALGEPVDYPDDPASLEPAYYLEGERYPAAELVARYEEIARARIPADAERVWNLPAHKDDREAMYRDTGFDPIIKARMNAARKLMRDRLTGKVPGSGPVDPVSALRAG